MSVHPCETHEIMQLQKALNKAVEAAKAAGQVILQYYQHQNWGLTYKPDGSPATAADLEAERIIKTILLGAFPNHSFTGEEFDPVNTTSDFRWYCDPIDGTWCVLNGEKTASVSIALNKGDNTVLAVVYNPFTDELFTGANGITAKLNELTLPKFRRENPLDAVYNFQIASARRNNVLALYEIWNEDAIAKLVSRGGSIAYNLAQIAEGSHSAYIVASTKIPNTWDISAGIYLIEAVGGVVEYFDEGYTFMASNNPVIHQVTKELLLKVNFGKR